MLHDADVVKGCHSVLEVLGNLVATLAHGELLSHWVQSEQGLVLLNII